MTGNPPSKFLHECQRGLISACVVTRNAQDSLKQYLDSLVKSNAGQHLLEIIVVDNDSSDETKTMLERDYPQAQYIFCQPGVGFSKGINLALSASRGEFIVIATPSTEILADAVPALLNFLERDEMIGVVGPKVVGLTGDTQHSSKKMPTPKVAMLHTLYRLGIIRSNKILNEYFLFNYESEQPLQVESLTMSLMLARRKTFEDVGFLDESLFAWASDVDWCYRLEQLNKWQQWFVPAAKVVHRRSSVSKKQPYTNLKYYHRDLEVFYQKYYASNAPWIVNVLWHLMLQVRFGIQILRFNLTKEDFSFY